MTKKTILVILLLVIFTFVLVGCDSFKSDIVSTEKTGAGLSITQVQNVEEVYVDSGTKETDVIDKLNRDRNKVDVILSDGREVEAEIAWEGADGHYNSEELDSYEFEGTVRYNDLSTDISIEVVVDDRYTLTLEIKGEGEILDKDDNIILSAPDNKKEIRYDPGSTLQFTAVPHEDWVFMDWKGGEDIDKFTVEINMDAHKELQAVFGNIVIFDVEKDFSSWSWYISGKLENLIGSKIEYIEIYVELYNGKDDDDPIIKYNVKEDIAEGEIVDWGVSGFADLKSGSYYKIVLKNIQLGE